MSFGQKNEKTIKLLFFTDLLFISVYVYIIIFTFHVFFFLFLFQSGMCII